MSLPFRILGYDHIKCALKDVSAFERVLKVFGFQPIAKIPQELQNPASVWGSGEAFFVLYGHQHPVAQAHWNLHGDTVFDLSFRVESLAQHPNVYEGAGKMKHTIVTKRSFEPVPSPRGILRFDHNTVNVEVGQMDPQVSYYEKTFGFEKGQYFKIRGKETGLNSWVTRTPNFMVQIPFNESADDRSQIKEFIDVHRGAGVQHIALLTPNIVQTMDAIKKDLSSSVKFLDVPNTYYEIVKPKIKIKESWAEVERLRVLADADQKQNYLLQIFTEPLFSAVFFELIQREGNVGFGEGNFQALFESMELDQKRRGVL